MAALALIASSLSPGADTTAHPLLPDPPTPNFSLLMQSELDRTAAKIPISGTDLSRYEAASTLEPNSTREESQAALRAAYTNSTYLSLRLQALELLEQFGKNAWLVGNAQLEDILREVERELVETRVRTDEVNRERKRAQEGARGQLEGGERRWRDGVGELVEVHVAVGEVEARWRERLRETGR